MIVDKTFRWLSNSLNTGNGIWKMLQKSRILIKNDGRKIWAGIRDNKALKDRYHGKRCFIVGNGPSLNSVDFSLLADEYVFTVNMLMDHPDFMKLKSNFHVITDAAIFDKQEDSGLEKNFLLKKFEKLKECKDIIFFAPWEAEESIENIGLDKWYDVRYYAMALGNRNITDMDIAGVMPWFNKVVHYAIGIALNLGFKEIYLLGCEETTILACLNLALQGTTDNDHCYQDSAEVKESWRRKVNARGMSWTYRQEAEVLDNYKKIADYCKARDVKLFNLTPRSLIDSIPKKKLEDVL